MKIRILQKVVSRKYSVHKIIDRDFIPYCYRVKEITSFDKLDINKDDIYELNVEYKPLNTECIDEFERYDMNYKVGDHMWYDNTEYTIKEVVDSGSEGIRIYLNKQRVVKEIGKEETEKLLKDIKIYQDELNEEYKEKIKTLNDEKIIKKDNNKSVIQKIKNYCIFKLGGSVNEG